MSARRIDLTAPLLLLSCSAFVIGEGLLLVVFAATPPAPLVALALHLLLTSALAMALFISAKGRDATAELIALATAAVTGPAGTLALIAGTWLYARAGRAPSATRPIGDDHASALALFQDLEAGRTRSLKAPAPAAFHALMTRGTLHERLSVLGVIAAGFHRDHLPVLRHALRNESAAVRAQAAALATTLRLRVKARAAAALTAWGTSDRDARDGLVGELAYCTRSGFLDPRQRDSIRTALRDIPDLTRRPTDARLLAAELAFEAGEYEALAAELAASFGSHTEPLRQIYLACLIRVGRSAEVRRLLREEVRSDAIRDGAAA